MKQIATSKILFASALLVLMLAPVSMLVSTVVHAQQAVLGTCSDGIDNDNDKRMDWNGGKDSQGNILPPDPSCANAGSDEVADQVTGSKIPLIPCVNKCDLGDVMQLINNLITLLIKFLFFPIAVFMFMYAGFKYITAQGNPSKKADIKKMVGHLIVGMLLVLCAWLIVKTILVTIGYTDNTYFFN